MDFLDSRFDKPVSADTLIELAELVLKNNIFEFSNKSYKQIPGTTTGTKFPLPYAVLFRAALDKNFLSKIKKKRIAWWRYVDGILLIWEHCEESFSFFFSIRFFFLSRTLTIHRTAK